MAIDKVRQLDTIEMLARDKVRVRVSQFYRDTVQGTEEAARDPQYVTLDPNNPVHQPVLLAARSLWDAALTAAKADR